MTKSTIYPDLHYPHVTKLDLQMAELIFPILVDLAPTGGTITYKGVVEAVRSRYPNISEVYRLHHRHVGRRLGTIWQFTEKHGCPHIGALVINQATEECGKGITSFLDPVVEREKIKSFDWSTVTISFESHIKKTRAAQTSKTIKLKKRTYDEAKDLFFEFWARVKDDVPIKSGEMAKFRDELIASVKEGNSPATALANKLLELINSGITKKESVEGYVYIGEYRNAQTDEPLFDQVKIGFTTKPLTERAVALSGGVVGPLKFVMTHAWRFPPDYAYAAEQHLHGVFDDHRQTGEFFSGLDGLIQEWAIEELSSLPVSSELVLVDGAAI